MAQLTEEQEAEKVVEVAKIKAEKEAKLLELKLEKAAAAAKAKAEKDAAPKVKVNFGVHIPHMRKAYTVEEIEADAEVQDYLLSIGSPAVKKLETL